jgi:hypothetical protein
VAGERAEAVQESPGEMAVGTRVREARKFLGKRLESVMEVTAHEPGRELGLKAVSGPIRLRFASGASRSGPARESMW